MRAYAILPDKAAPNGYRLSPVPDGAYKFKAYEVPPLDLSFPPTRAYVQASTISLDVVPYAKEERLSRRERRSKARAGGRRRAIPVPVSMRWEAYIAAHPDIPKAVVRRVVEEHAEVVERVWHRKEWRRDPR